MSILLQGGRFKKRLMPILLSVALAGCSNLFGSSLPKHYNVMPMQVLSFI